MSIYHLNLSAISRSAGRTAVAAAAYRAGVELTDPRTGEVHDYTRKGGVVDSIIVMPEGCTWQPTRQELWGAVESHHKRGDAVPAREIDVALPHELDAAARKRLAVDLARGLANHYGVAVDVALHAPDKQGNGKNWHAHVLFSACSVGQSGELGKKVAMLDPIAAKRAKQPNAAELLRPYWEKLVNRELERAGLSQRVDHRSLEAQGIERQPTVHLGPAATAMERRGAETELGDKNRQVADRAQVARMERWQRQTDDLVEREEAELALLVQERDALRQAQAKPAPGAARSSSLDTFNRLLAEQQAKQKPAQPSTDNSVNQPPPAAHTNPLQKQLEARRRMALGGPSMAVDATQSAAAAAKSPQVLLAQLKAKLLALVGRVVDLREGPFTQATGTIIAANERWAAMHHGRDTLLIDREKWPVEEGRAYSLKAGQNGPQVEGRLVNSSTASSLKLVYGEKVAELAKQWAERDKALAQSRTVDRGGPRPF